MPIEFKTDKEKLEYLNAWTAALTTTKEEIVNGDEVFYVERHSVAEGTFGFSDLKSMVLLAAKLRNKAVFFTRQHFFNKTGRNFQYDMFEHIENKYVSYNTLYRYLYDTTDINFFVGCAINAAHQHEGLALAFSTKMQIIDEMTKTLRLLDKNIKISYF